MLNIIRWPRIRDIIVSTTMISGTVKKEIYMVTGGKKQVKVLAGCWTTPAGSREKAQLVGSRCRSCGEVFFPKKTRNFCTHCQHETLTDTKLSHRGKINAFTAIMQQPGGGYYFGPVPYVVATVELPEGVFVESLIKTDNFQDLKVGMEVELVIEKVWEDPAGNELIGYKFRPV